MPQGSNHQSTSLMLETYEAFKRKHLSQNKEIIHKNSELHKHVARQISLMRAERLSLKGSHFQLECENAALRDKLDRAQERERQLVDERDRLRRHGGGPELDYDQVEGMRIALANAVAALQAFGLMLPSSASPTPSPQAYKAVPDVEPASPSTLPLSSTSSAPVSAPDDPNSNISVSRRRSLAARAARPSFTAAPDLSNISEGDASSDDPDAASAPSWRQPVLSQMTSEPPQPRASTSTATVPRARSPSPPPPTSPPPVVAPLSTLTRPSRAPRAPPKAPSAASHDSLSLSASTPASGRPKRRVSGMLRPRIEAAGFSTEEGMAEEEEEEEERREDSEDEYVPPAALAAPARAARKSRASGVGAALGTSTRATRSGRTPEATPEPELDPAEEQAEETEEIRGATRAPLREVQQVAATGPRASTAGKVKANSVAAPDALSVGATDRKPVEEPRAAAAAAASAHRGSALLKAKKDALRRLASPAPSAAEADGSESETSLQSSAALDGSLGATPTAAKARLGRAKKAVEEMDTLSEEGGSSQPVEEQEEGAGGRRARKSVNYALPKLNTKMRRPEDYKPVTKPAVPAAKPRKSTKVGSIPPPPPSDTPAPRVASLAGKKPPAPAAVAPDEDSPSEADEADEAASDEDEDDDDAWSEQKFLRRASGVTSRHARASSAATMDAAERRQLVKPVGRVVTSRRHSVAV
ncbi:hypothetical protein Rhopal_001446-T1 [Rhodotorula paludigena]|uniref:Shugoshin C-terminal domain-containing protein n=1 Tax=Rhodotorula paludigena TaxID=86838 RepID=A0AAV5GFI2_9BASI|nr:hypothetical protein Rhopal_001446-T1 [Rhodotorula paludigena]